MTRERAERIKKEIGQSMTLLGRGLGRTVSQVAAMIGPMAVVAWGDMYRAKGYVIVARSWGAEVYRDGEIGR